MARLLIISIYCLMIAMFTFKGYAESSAVKLPKDKLYLGAAIESYDNFTMSVELGYEINDFWIIQMDLPVNSNFAFIDGIYRFEGREGFFILGGVGVSSNVMLKPGLGYSFKLQDNVFLQAEVDSYILLGNNFQENMSGKMQVMFYF